MTDQTAPLSPRPLSLRHERFVAEFLKDGNATQAYIRAGYSPRGAQPSASKLLRRPAIAAALAAGQERIARALEVDATRIAQEYARIAYASIGDFVSSDAAGRLRIDLDKAGQAQRAGIVELRVSTHGNQEQRVVLKLGKLQALAALTRNLGVLGAKPAPGLTAQDRERLEEHCEVLRRLLDHREEEQRRLEQELREARAALARAEAMPASSIENPDPLTSTQSRQAEGDAAIPATAAQAEASHPPGPPDTPPAEPRRVVEPGMPTGAEPDYRPGLYPDAKFIFTGGRQHKLGPDSADALKAMKPGGFPGW